MSGFPKLMDRALRTARQTKQMEIGSGLLASVPSVFENAFGSKHPAIIADPSTYSVAGQAVRDAFAGTKKIEYEILILDDPSLYAEHKFVEQIQNWLVQRDAIPIAVGSGTINDLTKLAAHRLNRPYMCVATAASMDGYTAFGASITHNGVKQTFQCPAPAVVVADLGVIRQAPQRMNASGYADLLAKITAGADWILADALGVEPIDSVGWELVQVQLIDALSDPAGVRKGELEATRKLTEGLMMGGFAMQWTQSSRPASGAEHQFSHLWDMQNHAHDRVAPSHGFKVGIGTIAIARLYEHILNLPLNRLDIDGACAAWPSKWQVEANIMELLGTGELAEKARQEMAAKYIELAALRAQLTRLVQVWPELARRLREQLPPVAKLRQMLREVGAPTEPEQIGITRPRLRESFRQAYLIRRRFTVLDLVNRAAIFESSLDHCFKKSKDV